MSIHIIMQFVQIFTFAAKLSIFHKFYKKFSPLLSPLKKAASVCEPIEVKIITLCQGFPLGGSSSHSEVMRGSRLTTNLFSTPKSGIFQASPPCFPLRESLPNCRSKAIPASKVASACEPIEVHLKILAHFSLPQQKKYDRPSFPERSQMLYLKIPQRRVKSGKTQSFQLVCVSKAFKREENCVRCASGRPG